LKPWEFSRLSNKDYVILCIGHKNKLKRQEYRDRALQYAIVSGYADPKHLPKIEVYWPIEGEPKRKIRIPSKERIMELNKLFKNFGKNG